MREKRVQRSHYLTSTRLVLLCSHTYTMFKVSVQVIMLRTCERAVRE